MLFLCPYRSRPICRSYNPRTLSIVVCFMVWLAYTSLLSSELMFLGGLMNGLMTVSLSAMFFGEKCQAGTCQGPCTVKVYPMNLTE